jgi:hypothetical protein
MGPVWANATGVLSGSDAYQLIPRTSVAFASFREADGSVQMLIAGGRVSPAPAYSRDFFTVVIADGPPAGGATTTGAGGSTGVSAPVASTGASQLTTGLGVSTTTGGGLPPPPITNPTNVQSGSESSAAGGDTTVFVGVAAAVAALGCLALIVGVVWFRRSRSASPHRSSLDFREDSADDGAPEAVGLPPNESPGEPIYNSTGDVQGAESPVYNTFSPGSDGGNYNNLPAGNEEGPYNSF